MTPNKPNNSKTLYLQGGPGLNCAVERNLLGEALPVLWWEPPRFPADTNDAYQRTLDAAAQTLLSLQEHNGELVAIVAWSFGARLALDLAHRTPEAIRSLTLLAPTVCLESAFARFHAHIKGDRSLDASAPSISLAGDHDRLMQQVMAILTTPNVFEHYWATTSRTQFAQHSYAVAQTDWFDLPTFTAISREVVQRPIIPLTISHRLQIRIWLGRFDPYRNTKDEITAWDAIFPGATIQIADCGHMVPFEIPVARWLGSD